MAAHGFDILWRPKPDPAPADVLILWNRKGGDLKYAATYERAGARVLIAENAYIGRHHDGSQKSFALAWGHHNGRGQWPVGPDDRWPLFQTDLADWRDDGGHVLVLPQRGIGEPGIAMPPTWQRDVHFRLRKLTRREIRIRRHPGGNRSAAEPYDDLRGAWCAVTWGSGAAIKALAAGIPVFHELKGWIGAPAATFGALDLETPNTGDRLAMFRRLAWAQWSQAEIQTGEAFEWLLR